jgi:hypothetical protein
MLCTHAMKIGACETVNKAQIYRHPLPKGVRVSRARCTQVGAVVTAHSARGTRRAGAYVFLARLEAHGAHCALTLVTVGVHYQGEHARRTNNCTLVGSKGATLARRARRRTALLAEPPYRTQGTRIATSELHVGTNLGTDRSVGAKHSGIGARGSGRTRCRI